jgi:hypothetical protein
MTCEVKCVARIKDLREDHVTPEVGVSSEDARPESSGQEQSDTVSGLVKLDILGDTIVSAVDSSLIESRTESELALHTPLINQQDTDVSRQTDSVADVEPAEHDTSQLVSNAPTGVDGQQTDTDVALETEQQVYR